MLNALSLFVNGFQNKKKFQNLEFFHLFVLFKKSKYALNSESITIFNVIKRLYSFSSLLFFIVIGVN